MNIINQGKYPQDWEQKKIKEITTYVDYRGKTPTKVDQGVFLVTARNVKEGYIDYEISKEYVKVDEYNEIMRRGKPQIGDILITTEAPMGNVAQIDREDIALAQRIIKLRGKDGIDNSYLKYHLLSEIFQNKLKQLAIGSTVSGIKGKELHNIEIPLPNIKEQQKIASILSTWDKAIELKEKLIAEKKEQKKGLMQKLLTGKIRFEGFNEPWKKEQLGKIATIVMGQSPKSDSYNEIKEGIPLIQGNADIKNRRTIPRVWTTNPTKRCHPKDILMTVRAPVGSIALSEHEACIGRGVCAIKANINSDYLYYQLIQRENMWGKMAQGSTFESINSNDIKELIIEVPTEEEQIAIAKVLKVADKNLALLKRELEELHSQKKSLMQQLLTGKIRVKV